MTAWIVAVVLIVVGAAAYAWAMNADDAGHGEGE
jgi:hypothetical protein